MFVLFHEKERDSLGNRILLFFGGFMLFYSEIDWEMRFFIITFLIIIIIFGMFYISLGNEIKC
jgi:hypothetical protein